MPDGGLRAASARVQTPGQRSGRLFAFGSWVVVALVVWRAGAMLEETLRSTAVGLGPWGGDFHGGAWLAAQQILHGSSPYLAPDTQLLFRFSRAFVTPPPLGLAAVPLAHLPYGLAVALWNLLNAAGMVAALWLLGVRDLRMYLLALFAAPFISSLSNGQVEGVFALLLAVAWRYRAIWLGAVAVGALIAAKLYAFPLVIWLIATRRFRLAATAGGSAVLCLTASWAVIGFHGLAEYPRLLHAASRVADREAGSLSPATLVLRLGGTHGVGNAVAVCFGVSVMALIVLTAADHDQGWFSAAVTGGLVGSPILWDHYLVLLFIPLAVSRPRSLAPWLLTSLLWSGYAFASPAARAAGTLSLAVAIPVLACAVPEPSLENGPAFSRAEVMGLAGERRG